VTAPSGSRVWSARLPVVVGYAALFLLVGVFGAWSLGTRIAGAVVAPGKVDVESELQVVQHADGGVVGEIRAREGDMVAAGDVLLVLDDTFLRSELSIVEQQLHELFARGARLEAERDGRDRIDFSRAEPAHDLDPRWMQAQVEGQRQLFAARRARLEKETAQLAERKTQSRNQISGYRAEIGSITERIALIAEELEDQRSLYDRKLVAVTRMRELMRQKAQLEGARSRLEADVAEAMSEIAEIETQILQLRGERQEEAIVELRDLRYMEIELRERRLNLLEQLSRLEIRAPVAGRVFDTRVAALKSVIRPAEPIMHIVPNHREMHIKATVDPLHVDQIHPGQPASLRFTSFNIRTTPQVPGEVTRISADAMTDPETGARYYEAIVTPDWEAVAATPELKMLPGMPVEAFIETRARRPLDYLTQPFTDYFHRAWRD